MQHIDGTQHLPTPHVPSALHTGISQSDNIKVAIRVRPLSLQESAAGGSAVVTVAQACFPAERQTCTAQSAGCLHVTASGTSQGCTNVVWQQFVPAMACRVQCCACCWVQDGSYVEATATDGNTHRFHFHCCMGPQATQSHVKDGCGATQLMEAALAGYHATIFAYGQTSAGKTYTMFGNEDGFNQAGQGQPGPEGTTELQQSSDQHDGLIFQCMQYLFDRIAAASDHTVQMHASCLEIYNEGIFDLLNISGKQLPLKFDADKGFWVQGLRNVKCSTLAKFVSAARQGFQHRRTGAHALNHESSRSHAVLTVHLTVTGLQEGPGGTGSVTQGKITFVDLAGSERVKETRAAGATMKEANSINSSLFTLSKVISALSEPVRCRVCLGTKMTDYVCNAHWAQRQHAISDESTAVMPHPGNVGM
jgi:Kinesin motor domain